jgi:hypothetical protein
LEESPLGLVAYRQDAREAERAKADLQAALDPYLPVPVSITIERWNPDLGLWQNPRMAGGDRETLSRLRWLVRAQLRTRRRHERVRLNSAAKVMVGWSDRYVLAAAIHESGPRPSQGVSASLGPKRCVSVD